MIKVLLVSFTFLPCLLWSNEALDLLERELDEARGIYEDQLRVAAEASDGSGSKLLVAPDSGLPPRWTTKGVSKISSNLTERIRLSSRGSVEYQNKEGDFSSEAGFSRTRIGLEFEIDESFNLLADGLLARSGNDLGWERLQLGWHVNEQIHLKLGKFPPPFSTEFSQDASRRWFADLSPLVTQVAPASSLGALVDHTSGKNRWMLGWFGSEVDRVLPSLDANGYLLASLAHSTNLGGSEKVNQARFQRWHLDYLLNQDPSEVSSLPLGYEHIIAAGFQYSSGRLDSYSDLIFARGEQSSMTGITAAIGYWLQQDVIRLVARFDYANSSDDGGVVVGWGIPKQGREALFVSDYDLSTSAGRLASLYTGFNYHLNESSIVIGTGMEYRFLSEVVGGDDIRSWGWNTFARVSF